MLSINNETPTICSQDIPFCNSYSIFAKISITNNQGKSSAPSDAFNPIIIS
jgi:hypothetical protein